jgi:hypothetical protein
LSTIFLLIVMPSFISLYRLTPELTQAVQQSENHNLHGGQPNNGSANVTADEGRLAKEARRVGSLDRGDRVVVEMGKDRDSTIPIARNASAAGLLWLNDPNHLMQNLWQLTATNQVFFVENSTEAIIMDFESSTSNSDFPFGRIVKVQVVSPRRPFGTEGWVGANTLRRITQ